MYIHKQSQDVAYHLWQQPIMEQKKKIMGNLFLIKRESHIKTSKTENACLAMHLVALEQSLKEANII